MYKNFVINQKNVYPYLSINQISFYVNNQIELFLNSNILKLTFKHNLLFIIILINTINLSAQIQKKIEYQYKMNAKKVFALSLISMFSRSNIDLQTVKIKGVDDSLKGDNTFKLILRNKSLVFQNIESMEILNDSTLLLNGTWWENSYELDAEEANKKIIYRKINGHESEFIKVRHDNDGKAYIKQWHRNSDLVLSDSQIISITVKNYDIWLNNAKEKQKTIDRYSLNRVIIQGCGGLIALGIVLILYPVLK